MIKLLRSRAFATAVVAVLAVVAAAWAGAGRSVADSPSKAHPAVAAFAARYPGERIPVIVQAKDSVLDVVGDVAGRGGTDVSRLDVIGGVAATMSAADVDRISRDPDVDFVSLDAPMLPSGRHEQDEHEEEHRPGDPAASYPYTTNAAAAWDAGVTGRGVTVAVVDSGIARGKDWRGRVSGMFEFSSITNSVSDKNGHGTWVSGIIGAKGEDYRGIAPGAQLLSLKVADRDGSALVSDVINALQWAVDNKDSYNIRVINISLTSSIADSYRQDPLDAAVEQAWLHGIVVVVAGGNFGGETFAADHAPANDPFVITAGAFDDRGTAGAADDAPVSWSGGGTTVDGYGKPEIVAPGVDIVSALAKGSSMACELKGAVVDDGYIRLSGTSASAAIVSGVVAMMLEENPGLTPNQVKFRLMATGRPVAGAAAPAVDAFDAVATTLGGEANPGAQPNDLIDADTGDIVYDSVLWRSVLWRSVLWRSVLWRSVLWRN